MGVGGLRLAVVVVAAEAAEGGVCRWADFPGSEGECAGALSGASWRLAEISEMCDYRVLLFTRL